MVNDPIGDFIIQLKNAGMAKKDLVVIPYSKFKFAVANKLQQKGFIKTVMKRGKKTRKCIEIELFYTDNGSPSISGVDRVSKPGKRVYQGANDIHGILAGKGALILSTPKGVLTGEEARKEHVGGEALFKIW